MNNSKHFIEDYREHKIWYNEDTDKFTVELLVDENWQEKGRKSLKECRKAIDAHIKANAEFKPITCIRNNYRGGERVVIEQVRSDGGFVLSIDGIKQTEISEPLEQLKGKRVSYFKFSNEYIEWMDERDLLDKKQSAENKAMNEKQPKLEPLDLSFINDLKSQ